MNHDAVSVFLEIVKLLFFHVQCMKPEAKLNKYLSFCCCQNCTVLAKEGLSGRDWSKTEYTSQRTFIHRQV